MAFARKIIPAVEPFSEQLSSSMAGIEMNFDALPDREANIEDTIYFASMDGMDRGDLRTLSILTMWLESYSKWVIVDRLFRLVEQTDSRRVKIYWKAIAKWKQNDRRFRRFEDLYRGKKEDLLESGTDFLLVRNGEDPRFADGPLRVPLKTLRRRDMDVIRPARIQKNNLFLRYRIMMGPTFRSDMWALLDLHPKINTAELARRTYGSYPTAWQVKRDWGIVHGE